jgi:hypothetical protein
VLTTETEAKTKRCQEGFADVILSEDKPTTDQRNWSAPLNCIGSACMAWRWGKIINVYTPGATPQEFTLSQELGGYCGKAGKPVQLDMKDVE